MSAVHRKEAGLPYFSWGNIPKRENMNLKIPNGHKIYSNSHIIDQMGI
jgi:hypothetical protein